jgi:hypothetical protein
MTQASVDVLSHQSELAIQLFRQGHVKHLLQIGDGQLLRSTLD